MAKISDKPARIKVDPAERIVENGTLKLAIQLEYQGDMPEVPDQTIAEEMFYEAWESLANHIRSLDARGRQMDLLAGPVQGLQNVADSMGADITISSDFSEKTATIKGKKKAS